MKINISNKHIILLHILFFAVNFLSAQTNPKVYINEILSSNLTTNPDMVDFGDFSDWIELYNDENSSVGLSSYYLSDDFAIPNKWKIPSNTIISAKGFYLFWADGSTEVKIGNNNFNSVIKAIVIK
ncbi:MAG: lamin tail domain-containing protein [Ignavibacteriales bacterium]|nr:lamin tail domain-containing protein [Ignavibacteriota bacterium]MCB0747788.1 lamin tail domain-containing protein [Ignavibacteriota bacterium]MCB9248436.1 lamin tail domain-containing protein [Ignavibacteriales bacterium]